VVDSLKQGVLPVPLRSLRKGDYLTDEFSNASEMVNTLRLKLGDIQAIHEDLNRSIDQCNELSGKASQDVLMQSINEIRAKSSQLGDRIGYFTIMNNESPCGPSQDKTQPCSGNCACGKQKDGTPGTSC
jgi:hypothetical protein